MVIMMMGERWACSTGATHHHAGQHHAACTVQPTTDLACITHFHAVAAARLEVYEPCSTGSTPLSGLVWPGLVWSAPRGTTPGWPPPCAAAAGAGPRWQAGAPASSATGARAPAAPGHQDACMHAWVHANMHAWAAPPPTGRSLSDGEPDLISLRSAHVRLRLDTRQDDEAHAAGWTQVHGCWRSAFAAQHLASAVRARLPRAIREGGGAWPRSGVSHWAPCTPACRRSPRGAASSALLAWVSRHRS